MHWHTLVFAIAATSPVAAQAPSLLVVPDRDIGPLRITSTYQSLLQALGPTAIKRSDVHLGEGIFEPGAELFPNDSLRRATIYFGDTLGLTRPLGLTISSRGTLWQLPSGITVGTTLQRLEQLNGRPFTFNGFGWDYSGRGADWQGGQLATIVGTNLELGVTLAVTCQDALTPAEVDSLVGDRQVLSSDPAARRACIQVRELWLGFPANRRP